MTKRAYKNLGDALPSEKQILCFYQTVTVWSGVIYLSKTHFIDVDENQNLLVNYPWVVLVCTQCPSLPRLKFSSTKEDVGASACDLRSDSDRCHVGEASGEGCPLRLVSCSLYRALCLSSRLDSRPGRKPSSVPYYGNQAARPHTL